MQFIYCKKTILLQRFSYDSLNPTRPPTPFAWQVGSDITSILLEFQPADLHNATLLGHILTPGSDSEDLILWKP